MVLFFYFRFKKESEGISLSDRCFIRRILTTIISIFTTVGPILRVLSFHPHFQSLLLLYHKRLLLSEHLKGLRGTTPSLSTKVDPTFGPGLSLGDRKRPVR